MSVSLPEKNLPPTYQSVDVSFVFNSLLAGQSCSLIGIGSVGKSNLMQNLTRPTFKTHYLDARAPYLLTVYLDPHTLIPLEGAALHDVGKLWMGYELMLSRLYETYLEGVSVTKKRRSLTEDPLLLTLQPILHALRQGDNVTRQSGLLHLEAAVRAILADDDRWQIAFLLDEISDFASLPPTFFLSLRGLRDQFKGRLMYVTTSKTDVNAALLSADGVSSASLREFTELFGDHIRYISPLDSASAEMVIDRFIERYQHDYEIYDSGRAFLMKEVFPLTGGHVGLLRRSFRLAVQYLLDHETLPLSAYLLRHDPIRQECDNILNSLTPDEQQVFYHALNQDQILNLSIWNRLFEKHIVKQGKSGADFCIPLLGDYVLQQSTSQR